MNWYQNIFELIDLRSFSNMWFWIALAVVWSTTSHYVLGVPYDMVLRAKRYGGQAAQDLEDMVRIQVNRLLFIAQVSGLWILGFACFILTTLLVLGFFYQVEIAQALFLIGLPLSLVALLSLSTARLIAFDQEGGPHLWRRLSRHRIITQVIGMISIFVTALWGMYQNLSISPF